MLLHVSGFGHYGEQTATMMIRWTTLWQLFSIFYVNDAYLTLRDAELLQRALDILVDLFEWVGLMTNMSKMQTMICTPGQIQTQLPTDTLT